MKTPDTQNSKAAGTKCCSLLGRLLGHKYKPLLLENGQVKSSQCKRCSYIMPYNPSINPKKQAKQGKEWKEKPCGCLGFFFWK